MAAPIPDYSKVSLLIPMSGANNGTVFTDYSPVPKTVTRGGGAVTSTAQSKYYGASGLFDGTGDTLSIASHADFALGTSDFTVGMWARKTSGDAQTFQRLLQINSDAVAGQVTLLANAGTANEFRPYVAGYASGAGVTIVEPGASATTQDAWHHIELVRSGTTWYVWIDGVLSAQGTLSGYNIGQAAVYVGANHLAQQEYAGHIQDLYIIKGSALHVASFTPPTRLVGTLAIETRNESGTLVPRKVFAVPRSYTSKVTSAGTTDGSGALTLADMPACEHSIVAIADGDTLPDLVLRRLPT